MVAFDFDGTLVDTRAPILAAMRAALVDSGYAARSDGEVLSIVGLPLHEMFRQLGSRTADFETLSDRYRARFDEVAAGSTRLFDGVADLLARLDESGTALAVATSRGLKSLQQILHCVGQRKRFGLLVSGTCVERDKPHPEMLLRVQRHFQTAPDEIVMVGDTTFDMEMGRAAGVSTCAVTYGVHSVERLRGAKPTHIAHTVDDLRAPSSWPVQLSP